MLDSFLVDGKRNILTTSGYQMPTGFSTQPSTMTPDLRNLYSLPQQQQNQSQILQNPSFVNLPTIGASGKILTPNVPLSTPLSLNSVPNVNLQFTPQIYQLTTLSQPKNAAGLFPTTYMPLNALNVQPMNLGGVGQMNMSPELAALQLSLLCGGTPLHTLTTNAEEQRKNKATTNENRELDLLNVETRPSPSVENLLSAAKSLYQQKEEVKPEEKKNAIIFPLKRSHEEEPEKVISRKTSTTESLESNESVSRSDGSHSEPQGDAESNIESLEELKQRKAEKEKAKRCELRTLYDEVNRLLSLHENTEPETDLHRSEVLRHLVKSLNNNFNIRVPNIKPPPHLNLEAIMMEEPRSPRKRARRKGNRKDQRNKRKANKEKQRRDTINFLVKLAGNMLGVEMYNDKMLVLRAGVDFLNERLKSSSSYNKRQRISS